MPAKQKIIREKWAVKYWRPAMAWMYAFICLCDFFFFPIGWSILQATKDGQVTSQWDPLTLKGAGLFHMAMGAIIGVYAWTRGSEKIVQLNNGYIEESQSVNDVRNQIEG